MPETVSQQFKPIKPKLKIVFKQLMPGLGNTSFKFHADEYFIMHYRAKPLPAIEDEIERFKDYLALMYKL